jgi:hypothetical protein
MSIMRCFLLKTGGGVGESPLAIPSGLRPDAIPK